VSTFFFSCNIENQLEENLYKKFSHSKDVTLEKGCKDGRKCSSFCFNLTCIFYINKMNPVILLSIICTWYLKISSLPKLYYVSWICETYLKSCFQGICKNGQVDCFLLILSKMYDSFFIPSVLSCSFGYYWYLLCCLIVFYYSMRFGEAS